MVSKEDQGHLALGRTRPRVWVIARSGQYAIGCQKEIAARIVAAETDYVLALKQNQGCL